MKDIKIVLMIGLLALGRNLCADEPHERFLIAFEKKYSNSGIKEKSKWPLESFIESQADSIDSMRESIVRTACAIMISGAVALAMPAGCGIISGVIIGEAILPSPIRKEIIDSMLASGSSLGESLGIGKNRGKIVVAAGARIASQSILPRRKENPNDFYNWVKEGVFKSMCPYKDESDRIEIEKLSRQAANLSQFIAVGTTQFIFLKICKTYMPHLYKN
ncbi:MAG: hypothetical protein JO129_03630 [Candidatus Dependentiae bacterium]|nr:hypothetical protein [Candidatus Dependentiae bacterium]